MILFFFLYCMLEISWDTVIYQNSNTYKIYWKLQYNIVKGKLRKFISVFSLPFNKSHGMYMLKIKKYCLFRITPFSSIDEFNILWLLVLQRNVVNSVRVSNRNFNFCYVGLLICSYIGIEWFLPSVWLIKVLKMNEIINLYYQCECFSLCFHSKNREIECLREQFENWYLKIYHV